MLKTITTYLIFFHSPSKKMGMLELDQESLVQTKKDGRDAGYETATGKPGEPFSHLQLSPALAYVA